MIGIFQRLFAEKKAEDDAIQDEYHSMLLSLAKGEEIDLDDVRRLTIDAGKTEEECSRDLELMQQRIEKVAKKQEWIEVQKATPGLEQKRDALKAELNAVFERINPQLVKLEWDLHAASDAAAQCLWIDDFLNNNCLNKSLLEREREVGEQRKALGMQKRTLAEDLSKAKQHESYFHARLEKYNRKDGSKPKDAVDFKELQASRAEWTSTIEQLERAIALIDEELEPIDQELADIQKEKLLP
jgi:septal ring factor EnvC (AmiA/AmiB activator)